ncbi:adult-specific rigid cuticular protein 15.5-like [Oppia nitens]|uniref:adult-specific rigid cuticular protein 15.5-like n=1 Tax=Oppia nitens TaxID=1686743 RepID=UPI0023DB125D|nr:adult-specific rigid cuticular protein 15.5-like [Oppia nitens]
MNSAIIMVALIGYVSCGVINYAAPVVGVLESGASSQFRSQDNVGNYAFGYNEDHATGGTFRREQGAPGVQVGSYGLRDADGRVRVVNYVADAAGFRANVQSNEPGVEPKDPANVLINKAQAIVAAAAPVVAAPLAAPALTHYSAPVVAHTAYAAPAVLSAPVQSHSYSVSTQHVSHAPAFTTHVAAAPLAAPLIAAPATYTHAHLAAPVAYATKTVHAAAPLIASHW